MSTNKLNFYEGMLAPGQIAKGMNCAITNAKRLLQDAELLLSNGRYPSAVALGILAIEENGKVSILRGLAVARERTAAKKDWKDYRTHTRKNCLLGIGDLIRQGARNLDDFKPLFDTSEYPKIIDNVKQICIYTECLGNVHWSMPDEVIDKNLAELIVSTARVIVGNEKVITENEIATWKKNVGPVWKKDLKSMKDGLRAYFIEMHNQGLLDNLDEALEFIERMDWIQ